MAPTAALILVLAAEHYVGTLPSRAPNGFEAYDHADRGLGIYPIADAAVAALIVAAKVQEGER
jgi:hypothetical protein